MPPNLLTTPHGLLYPSSANNGADFAAGVEDLAEQLDDLALGRWSTIHRVDGYLPTTATTLMLSATSVGSVGPGGSSAHPAAFAWPCEPVDFAAGSVETDLRLRATIFTNSVVPGINFTFELRPITGYGGGSGSQAFISTIGSAATGATLTTADDDTSDPFAIPTSGLYVVAATASGTIAAGSLAQAIVEIQARSVGS